LACPSRELPGYFTKQAVHALSSIVGSSFVRCATVSALVLSLPA
jgi:hypothetical protein